jgi:Xaa-Pro dipeptidase
MKPHAKMEARMSENASPEQFSRRQSLLSSALVSQSLNALVLNPGPSLTYLTGLHFHLMERPVVTIFIPHSPPIIVLPELETAKLEELPFDVQFFPYGEDPSTWNGVFRQAALAAQLDSRRVGVEPGRLRVLELRYLESAAPEANFVSAEESLQSLRTRKDPGEITAMRRAVDIAQRAIQATRPYIQVGTTEREIAAELTLQLLRAGSEPQLPFFPIVSAGPNSANPHASPTDRPLEPGDLLVIDWGAAHQGYVSDLTRTFSIGPVEDELALIARIVQQANAAGRATAGPGIPAESVDKAARDVIDKAGYGRYFIHRTGHGIGMEGHEAPYIRAGNPILLEPGMTFTIEPGIYLPKRGGVRIEDNVVITERGCESLSDLPRELWHIDI